MRSPVEIIPDEDLHPFDVSGHPGPGQTFELTVIDDPCDPATPPSAGPAEPSSGGERSTAGGAGGCCNNLAAARALVRFRHEAAAISEGALRSFRFCPWCGTKL